MFTVTGYLDGVAYRVTVGAEVSEARARTVGCVSGDPNIIRWLADRAGEPYTATPTGPAARTDMNDPAAILGTLMDGTTITAVDGDAPDLTGPARPGIVY